MVFTDLLQQPFAQTLASALEHFLWQGAALGLALYVLVRALRPGAQLRYALGVGCLAMMALAPVATVAVVSARGSAGAGAAFATRVADAAPDSALAPVSGANGPARWNAQAVVVSAWAIGVLALSLRLGGGWIVTRRLVARSRARASAEIRWLADRLSRELAVGRHIEIFASSTIVVPVLIGWLAPVVILPTAAVSGLAPAQLEALIAHELAHVRRHDYLVNLLQSLVETLLFFHPAVWWVSRDVRESREHCCDDLVVGLCDRVVYASALADLAALVRGPRLALAATDGSLVNRVRRILGGHDDGRPARQEWIAAAVLAVLVVGTMPMAFASAHDTAAPAPATGPVAVGLQEPAVAIRATSDVEPATAEDRSKSSSVSAVNVVDGHEQRVTLDRSLSSVTDGQAADVRVIELKLQRELDELKAQPALARDMQERQAELQASLEKLQALLAERQATDAQLRQRKVLFEELQTKLAALERQIAAQKGALAERYRDQMADAQTTLERAKTIELDAAAMEKLKAARVRDALDQLAAEKARTDQERAARASGDAEAAATRDTLEQEFARRKEDLMRLNRPGNTDFDPKEIQSVIAPAFDAGPTDISVVGKVVRHPGRVEWHEGLTVEEALKAAGAPSIGSADTIVRRLSEVQVTFGAGGPRVNGRVDDVNADTRLRPGDVIVVSPRVRK